MGVTRQAGLKIGCNPLSEGAESYLIAPRRPADSLEALCHALETLQITP
jgi:hypothetical protein